MEQEEDPLCKDAIIELHVKTFLTAMVTASAIFAIMRRLIQLGQPTQRRK